MKTVHILIATLILLIWHSFLAHLDIFIGIEIFSALSVIIFLHYDDINGYFIWIVVMGTLLDLILARWLGINLLANTLGLFLCIVADRYFKILQSEQKALFVSIYLIICSSIIYSLSILSVGSVEFEINILIKRIIVNLILGLVINWLFSQGQYKREIKV